MREPMRVIEGSAKPGEAFWRMVDAAQSESGEAEVEFFGPISEYSWWGDEVTPKSFKDELYKVGKSRPVTVKVNSPGGEAFAAFAIRAILQDYPARVTADIIGLAASAATIVVSGANVVKMRETAMFMIHDPSMLIYGSIDEIQKGIDMLKKLKETVLDSYETKTGLKRDKLSQLMQAETWMTPSEAKEFGFVDEVISGEKPKNMPKNMRMGFVNCLKGYDNVPAEVIEEIQEEEPAEPAEATEEVIPVEEPASDGALADNERREQIAAEAAALHERATAIILREETNHDQSETLL